MTISRPPLPEEQPRDQLLFVYGTLKQGMPNHVWLPPNTRVDVGCAVMLDRYPLVADGLPFLLPFKGKGEYVEGQLYRISQDELELVDQLEGHPYLYIRTQVPVTCNGENYSAWVYFLGRKHVSRSLRNATALKSYPCR